MHFGKFATARAAKSIYLISSKCVFNPSYGLPRLFKIKILYVFGPYLTQTVGLDGQKPAKNIIKSIIY